MPDLKVHKGLAIAHLNVRSLWNKLNVLKINLQNELNIDIIGISESWLTNNLDDNLINIPNYNIIRHDRKWEENGNVKIGGGVCVYIKNDINYSTHALSMYNISCINVECQWVRIIKKKQRNVVIGNVYRPPQGKVKNFVDYIEGVMENLNLDCEDIILMGDFNIDFLDKTSSEYKQMNSLMRHAGLDAYIQEPTHFSGNKNSCLDQII